METAGWILMTVSLTFVWSLLIWCYRRVLSAPPPAQQVEEFHNA